MLACDKSARNFLRFRTTTLTIESTARCEDWYHPECVQIPEAHVELVDQFVCPNCEKSALFALFIPI